MAEEIQNQDLWGQMKSYVDELSHTVDQAEGRHEELQEESQKLSGLLDTVLGEVALPLSRDEKKLRLDWARVLLAPYQVQKYRSVLENRRALLARIVGRSRSILRRSRDYATVWVDFHRHLDKARSILETREQGLASRPATASLAELAIFYMRQLVTVVKWNLELDLIRARTELQQALSLISHCPEVDLENSAVAHNLLGKTLCHQRDLPAALREFKHAVELDPHLTEARKNLETVYEEVAGRSHAKQEQVDRPRGDKSEAVRDHHREHDDKGRPA